MKTKSNDIVGVAIQRARASTDDLRTRRLKNPLVIRTCQARFLANKNVANNIRNIIILEARARCTGCSVHFCPVRP